MNSKRAYQLMLGLCGLLVLGTLVGTYEVNNLLQHKSQALVKLKLQDQVLDSQQTELAQAKHDIVTYSDLNNIAKAIVPQDKDQAEAVLEITNLAKQSGISQLSSISFPTSTLGGTGTTSSGSKGKLTQLTPVPNIAGVYQLQITISQTSDNPVPYTAFIDFLTRLEQNRRTAQVGSITINPDTKNTNMVAFTLIINEFIKP